mmetsp:Transcript_2500/g.3777  ORF Transcript_2500/g.3777 Transcript_2500/m.3777 type:complete len:382 (+) Transcript_2500:209-1354(+)
MDSPEIMLVNENLCSSSKDYSSPPKEEVELRFASNSSASQPILSDASSCHVLEGDLGRDEKDRGKDGVDLIPCSEVRSQEEGNDDKCQNIKKNPLMLYNCLQHPSCKSEIDTMEHILPLGSGKVSIKNKSLILYNCLQNSSCIFELDNVEHTLPFGSGEVCISVKGVLDKEECNNIIERAEDIGFRPALLQLRGIQILDRKSRNSERCIIDDEVFTARLYDRLRGVLPGCFGSSRTVGLNERVRILKYVPGQSFPIHQDGQFKRGAEAGKREGEVSYFSVLVYLNSSKIDFQGGGTRMFLNPEKFVDYEPSLGDVLVFNHKIFHEGSEVLEGTKYCIRTDLMFEKPEQCPQTDLQVVVEKPTKSKRRRSLRRRKFKGIQKS